MDASWLPWLRGGHMLASALSLRCSVGEASPAALQLRRYCKLIGLASSLHGELEESATLCSPRQLQGQHNSHKQTHAKYVSR